MSNNNYFTNDAHPPEGINSKADVKAMQSYLVSEGYSVGRTGMDGIWGKNTQAAYDQYLNSKKPRWQNSGGDYNVSASYDKARNAYDDALNAAYEQTKGKYLTQAEDLKTQYDNVRGKVYTNSRLSAIGNNEALASMGLAGNIYDAPASGYSETSRVAENTAMRNSLNTTNLSEQKARDQVAQAIIDAGYAKDQASAQFAANSLLQEAQAKLNYQIALEQLQYQYDALNASLGR